MELDVEFDYKTASGVHILLKSSHAVLKYQIWHSRSIQNISEGLPDIKG